MNDGILAEQIANRLRRAILRGALPPGLLDGSVSCHYRFFPLLYARESDDAVAAVQQRLDAVAERG